MGFPQLKVQRRSPHRGVFFRSWLADPFHVAAIAPSGRWLARLMATGLTPGARVLELGAGTGTLTEAMLERGVRPQDIYLVEQHKPFVDVLRHRFPTATVVQADAAKLTTTLGELRNTFDYVISGLPIVWFSREKSLQIYAEAMALLRPSGSIHQFTYLGRPPVGRRLLDELGLEASLLGIAPMNLPPAFVYRFARKRA